MITPGIQSQVDVDSAIESIMQREKYSVQLQHGTIVGSYLSWISGDGNNGENILRKPMLEQRQQRESLLLLLEPSAQ